MLLPSLTAPLRELRDPFLQHPGARWCAIVAAALLALAWITILAVPRLPGDAPFVIHYTTALGIDALGAWTALLRLPTIGTVILAANLTVARILTTTAPPNAARPALPPTVAVLLPATVLLEFAVVLGSILLWRVNTVS